MMEFGMEEMKRKYRRESKGGRLGRNAEKGEGKGKVERKTKQKWREVKEEDERN